jgi:WD40 repeat protein
LADESCGVVCVSEQQQNGEYEWIHTIYDREVPYRIYNFIFSPMSRLYIFTEKTIEIYEVETGDWLESIHFDSENYGINYAISPDESLLAVTNYTEISIWDINEEKLLVEFDAHLLDILDLAFSPDGRYLATTSWDGTVRLWGIVP